MMTVFPYLLLPEPFLRLAFSCCEHYCGFFPLSVMAHFAFFFWLTEYQRSLAECITEVAFQWLDSRE